ncbi:MAG: hypothetical protein ACLR56_09985 [Oscillospiraceae bacterium]
MKNKLLRFAALALSLALASGTMTACDNKNNGSSKRIIRSAQAQPQHPMSIYRRMSLKA